MAKNHAMNSDKALAEPLKTVKYFFLDYYERKNVDAALTYVAEDIQFHGLGAPHTDLWNKEEVRSELVGMMNNQEELHVMSVDLDPRLLASDVCLVSGSITLGENSNTLILEICVVAVCRETEDGWKMIQLHTYFPWKESGYHYDGMFEIKKDYAAQIEKEFWQSKLPGGLFVCYHELPFAMVAINDSLVRQLGFQSRMEFQEFSGVSIVNSIHPDDVGYFQELSRKLKEGSWEEAIMCRIRRRDFTFGCFAIRGYALKDEEYGNILICSCNDITEEMQQEKDSPERVDTENAVDTMDVILENIPGGGYRCCLSGEVQLDFVSDGFCRITGFSRQDIRSRFHNHVSSLIYEEDRENYETVLQQMKEYAHTTSVQYRIRCRDGSLRWVMDTLNSVRHADRTMWVYGLITDIEREHIVTNQLAQFFHALPTGLAAVHLQHGSAVVQYCNQTLCHMLDRTEEELIGQNLSWLIQEQDRDMFLACMEKLQNGASTADCQIRLQGMESSSKVYIFARAQERVGERLTIYLVAAEMGYHTETVPFDLSEGSDVPQVMIRTFGYFDVFVDGKPILFQSAKSKELLALLVDRGGGYVSATEIISCLWENESSNKVTLARCRKVAMRLTDKLKEYGVEDIIESVNGSRRVVPSRFSCDLYDYLAQKPGAENLFKGIYLANYSWGEMTLSNLLAQRES